MATRLVLVAEPAPIRQARARLAALANGLLDESRRPDLALVVTEVATDAVRHISPGGPRRLAATLKPEFLYMQVTDEGPGLVPHPYAMASDEHGGFRLFMSSGSRAAGESPGRTITMRV